MSKQTPFYNVAIGCIIFILLGLILVTLKYFYKRKKMYGEKYEKEQTLLEKINQKTNQGLDQYIAALIQTDISFFNDQDELVNSEENKDQNLKKIFRVLAYLNNKKQPNQVKKNEQHQQQVKQGVKDQSVSQENLRVIKELKKICSKMTKQEYTELRQRIQQKMSANANEARNKQLLISKQSIMLEEPNKTIFLAFAQKFSLAGGFFNKDKKYLLKQFFIISMFGVSILQINKIEIWPLALGFGGLIISFIVYQYVLKGNWRCLDNLIERKSHQIHSGVELDSQIKERSKSRLNQVQRSRHLQHLQNMEAMAIQNNEPIYPAISSSNSDNNLNFHCDINQDTNSNVFKPTHKNRQDFQVSDVVAVTQRDKNSKCKNRSHKVRLSPMKPRDILKQANLNVHSPIKVVRNLQSNTKGGLIIQTSSVPKNEMNKVYSIENAVQSRKSKLQAVFIALLSILTLIMFTNSMLTIYNSISNLGPLNLASCIIMVLIDQICIRGSLFFLTFLIAKFLHWTQLIQLHENKFIFETICGDFLQQKVEQIQDQIIYKEMLIFKLEQLYAKKLKQMYNDNPDAQMTVSPTRKKGTSPSRIPKAKRESKENCEDETGLNLLQLQKTCMSKKTKSRGGRSQRKDILGQCNEDEQLQQYDMKDNNKNKDFHSLSAQRPMKNAESILKIHNFNDDLVLVDNVLNYMEEPNQNDSDDTQNAKKFKDFTIDIDFSPTKHVRSRQIRHKSRKNKRQILITGSSPYLQYLPDMMKKVERSLVKGKDGKHHNSVQGNLIKKSQLNQTINANSKEKDSHMTFELNSRIL